MRIVQGVQSINEATDPAACASPDAATPPSLAAPTAAGAQTARPVTAIARGPGSTWPETVTVTIAGVEHVIDVTPDRDDWELPSESVPDEAVRILWAIDDAIEVWHRDADVVPSRSIERVWAARVTP